MPNYEDINEALQLLVDAQDVENDNRRQAREAQLFVEKIDGQWEPYWWNARNGAPRYTFDETSPIIDQIAGEIEQADFDIQVRPAGGDASKEEAKTLDGLIRNIENVSNATHVFNHAARNMVTMGIDGWRVAQRYINDDSFDQDLMIEPIYNFVDRVWFDPGAERQDKSDARYAFVLQSVMRDEYEKDFPEGSAISVSDDRISTAYYYKPDAIIIGQIYYIKHEDVEIALMSNGAVYEVDDKYKKVRKELKAAGVEEERRRMIKKNVVYSRLFDGSDWLTEPQRTVFCYIPVIPTYANYKIFENKTIYRGVVQKLMDTQRVMNYTMSRMVEEAALAPRAKYWMTQTQAAGHESRLSTMNTNQDPVQFYNNDAAVPGPPQVSAPAPVNPGLAVITEAMSTNLTKISGMFSSSMGDNPGLQSGVAIKALQDKGDTGTIKFFSSQEIAICHTARILIDAIPKVYDTRRQVRILGEDGSFSMVMLNDVVFDEETQKEVTLNDLSKGTYDVTCSAGPSFQNRQQEAVQGFLEVAQVDPSVMETGKDVFLGNINSPGMDQVAERARMQLFNAGAIPEEQMTEDEKQKLAQAQQAAAQQGQQPDAATLIAQAELIKAQDEQAETQVSIEEKSAKIQLEARKQQLDEQKFAFEVQKFQAEAELEQVKLALNAQNQEVQNALSIQKQQMDEMTSMIKNVLTSAQATKTTAETMGTEIIMSPGLANNLQQGTELVSEQQNAIEIDN